MSSSVTPSGTGIRGKAAALTEASGFLDRVRELLKAAPAVHADETPARVAGGMRYVHLACTQYLTHMHTGDRSAPAIDAGGVLPGYDGIIVRDGYFACGHLTGALHAWCGAHLLRDLRDLYDFEPGKQVLGAAVGRDRRGSRCPAGRERPHPRPRSHGHPRYHGRRAGRPRLALDRPARPGPGRLLHLRLA
ncbi:MAG: transposase [Actinomycetota bacterium]|nr:transposase [Actinomycetota bacterium]